MRAVRFDHYGDIDVLQVRLIPRPTPGPGEVLVGVKAAGINPGEATIRKGLVRDQWPTEFPSGQGSDLAGVVTETGPGVETFTVGNRVLGFTHRRASQAEFVVVPADQLTDKPRLLSWEVAGALFVAGTTAYAAVRAIEPIAGATVAVSAAAGGVGSIAVQLATRAGATVLGIAGKSNDEWLSAHGVIPVNYGPDFADLAGRLKAAAPNGRVDAFLDCYGSGYVQLAVAQLGMPPRRVKTIAEPAAADLFGVGSFASLEAGHAAVLSELANLAESGELDVPIDAAYPLDEVRQAYRRLERRHTPGKIVLLP